MNRVSCIALCACLVAGCASTPDTGEAPPQGDEREPTEQPLRAGEWDEATLNYAGQNVPFTDAAREIGRAAGGGVVAMNGLERRRIDVIELSNVNLRTAMTDAATKIECAVQITPDYYFVHPIGYEALHEVSLQGSWPEAFDDISGNAVFRNGTPMFTVFRLLSAGFDANLVVDNAVASADSGEIVLGDVPLRAMAEAALKSARVAPGSFAVTAGEDYVFVHAAARTIPPTYCLNPEDANRAQLAKRVNIELPSPPIKDGLIDIDMGAAPLDEVIGRLSRQCGISIKNEPSLDAVPVNPITLRNVTVQTALDLIIAQWLTDDVRYAVNPDGSITLRRR